MINGDMPAVAHMELNQDNQVVGHYEGLTKREHFAGLAMQGFIAAGVNGMPCAIELSILATHYADTLLKKLGENHDI